MEPLAYDRAARPSAGSLPLLNECGRQNNEISDVRLAGRELGMLPAAVHSGAPAWRNAHLPPERGAFCCLIRLVCISGRS